MTKIETDCLLLGPKEIARAIKRYLYAVHHVPEEQHYAVSIQRDGVLVEFVVPVQGNPTPAAAPPASGKVLAPAPTRER